MPGCSRTRRTARTESAWSPNAAHARRIVARGEIAGERVVPFFPEGPEGLAIDYPDDFERAERLAAERPDLLPEL